MNDRFNMKYVRESIDLFFNKTIIEHSSNASQHILNQDMDHMELKNFSVSHHAVFIIPKFLSVFPYTKSFSTVASQLLEIVADKSQFSDYFSGFYSKIQFDIERAALYLLILTLVKLSQIKEEGSDMAKNKLKQLEKMFTGQADKVKVRLDCLGLGSCYLENQFLVPVTKDLLGTFKYTALVEYIDQIAKSANLTTLRRYIKDNVKRTIEGAIIKESKDGDSMLRVNEMSRILVEENLLHGAQTAVESKISENPGTTNFPTKQRRNSKDRIAPHKPIKSTTVRSEESGKDRKALFFENFIKDSKSDAKKVPNISAFDVKSKDKLAEPKRQKTIQKLTSQLSLIPKTKQTKTRMIKSSYTDKYVTKKKQAQDEYVINLRNVNENFNKLYSDVMIHNSSGELDYFKDNQSSAQTKPNTVDEEEFGYQYHFDDNQQSIQFADLCNEIQDAKTPVKGMLHQSKSS